MKIEKMNGEKKKLSCIIYNIERGVGEKKGYQTCENLLISLRRGTIMVSVD